MKKHYSRAKCGILAAVAACILSSANSNADLVEFYVGIDGRSTLTSGTYRGLPNPNARRLTFLYGHGYPFVPGSEAPGETAFDNNHYHAISSYSYAGPTNNPTVLNTNANSRIPEISTKQRPLILVPGNGLYQGKRISAKTAEHYSSPTLHSVWKLNDPTKYGPGSPEWIMFHSSGGTRTYSLAGAEIALELIAKSEGLHIGSTNQLEVLRNPGDRHSLGDGNAVNFTPVFWVEESAPVGHYWVALKLVDVNTNNGRIPIPESGVYYLDFQVAPEPALTISKAVTLSLPSVTPGYLLEGAPSVEGPWTTVPAGGAHHSGNQQILNLPADTNMQFFRLRKQ